MFDVAIPGLDELLRDSSMITSDIKFDPAETREIREPTGKSLGELLDRGLIHSALESTFRMRNAVAQRDTEASRLARIKRTAIRHAIEATLAEHRLNALVYPTIRRKPSRIGDTQIPSNCPLSSHSGLPALSVPAGFTDDGLPVGMDLLGGAFEEQNLLSLGFSIEQLLQLRKAPFSTPALVAGKRAGPRSASVVFDANSPKLPAALHVVVDLRFDEATSRLDYGVRIDPAARHEVIAIWTHAGTVEKPGAARHLIYAPGQPASGSVALSGADRKDVANGTALLRLYLRDHAGVADEATLIFR